MYFLKQLHQQFICTLRAQNWAETPSWQQDGDPKPPVTDAQINAAVNHERISEIKRAEANDPDGGLPDTDSAYETGESEENGSWVFDKGGSIDNNLNSLSISEINQRIAEIDEEMATLDTKSDLTDADFDRLDELDAEKDALQKQLIALENQETAQQEATIEAEQVETAQQQVIIENEKAETAREESETAMNEATIEAENNAQEAENVRQSKNEATIEEENQKHAQQESAINTLDSQARSGIEEIKSFLSPDIRTKYPKLDKLLAPTDAILQKEKLSEADDNTLKEALKKTLQYLIAPQNRDELRVIYWDIKKTQGTENANAFRVFLKNQDPEFEVIFREIDHRDAHIDIALDGSDIADIDGDIIRGENGEILDMSGDVAELRLQVGDAEDGLELNVSEVDAAQTEQSEQEISDMHKVIEANTQKIEQNEKRLKRYTNMLSDLKTYDPQQFSEESMRENFVKQLKTANPELADISPEIDFAETGQEFLQELISYISTKKDATEKSTEILKAQNVTLKRKAGILATKVETQKRLATEKLRNKKERVKASRDFYERSATSPLVAKVQHLFDRISGAEPVVLPNGKTITHFNISTFEMIPSPGEGDASDRRYQEVFLAIANQILGAQMIELGAGGMPVFKRDGKIIDRVDFEAFLAQKVGDPMFEMKAIWNLFGMQSKDTSLA